MLLAPLAVGTLLPRLGLVATTGARTSNPCCCYVTKLFSKHVLPRRLKHAIENFAGVVLLFACASLPLELALLSAYHAKHPALQAPPPAASDNITGIVKKGTSSRPTAAAAAGDVAGRLARAFAPWAALGRQTVRLGSAARPQDPAAPLIQQPLPSRSPNRAAVQPRRGQTCSKIPFSSPR